MVADINRLLLGGGREGGAAAAVRTRASQKAHAHSSAFHLRGTNIARSFHIYLRAWMSPDAFHIFHHTTGTCCQLYPHH